MSTVPRYVVLQSNHNKKYLSYVEDENQREENLQFSGEEVVSPLVKFHVETAKVGKGFVNIRSCYNNKYWVRSSSTTDLIVGKADEPNENQSDWCCTLFEPIYVNHNEETVLFRHVQLGNYATIGRCGPPKYGYCIYAKSASPDRGSANVFKIINWESLVILPRYVAFKGDNDRYLFALKTHGHEYLEFLGNDIGDQRAANETLTNSDGTVRFRSVYFDRFWVHNVQNNWIWVYASANPDDIGTWFLPVKVGENVIALRNMRCNRFCKRLSRSPANNSLSPDTQSITVEAQLKVEEPVLSRRIYNVNFRLNHARIYDQSVLTMAQGDAVNRSTETSSIVLKLLYTHTKTRSWNSSISVKLGAKVSFDVGIPEIFQGKVELSIEFSGSYQWGETETTTTTPETDYTVSVPPMSRVKVSLLATRGRCDVPFSYTQFDTLTDGRQITTVKDDGVYTGMNCYNFKYETTEMKLD